MDPHLISQKDLAKVFIQLRQRIGGFSRRIKKKNVIVLIFYNRSKKMLEDRERKH